MHKIKPLQAFINGIRTAQRMSRYSCHPLSYIVGNDGDAVDMFFFLFFLYLQRYLTWMPITVHIFHMKLPSQLELTASRRVE